MISCSGVWESGRRNCKRKRAALAGLPSEALERGDAEGSISDCAFWTSELNVNMAKPYVIAEGGQTSNREAVKAHRLSIFCTPQAMTIGRPQLEEAVRGINSYIEASTLPYVRYSMCMYGVKRISSSRIVILAFPASATRADVVSCLHP